jgi:hypothetical protein
MWPIGATRLLSLYSVSIHVLSNMSQWTVAITSRIRVRDVLSSSIRCHALCLWCICNKKKFGGVISGERGGQEIVPSRILVIHRFGRVSLNFNTPVGGKGDGILLVDDIRLQIGYLRVHKLFQRLFGLTIWNTLTHTSKLILYTPFRQELVKPGSDASLTWRITPNIVADNFLAPKWDLLLRFTSQCALAAEGTACNTAQQTNLKVPSRLTKIFDFLCRIWGSHSVAYEAFHLLRCESQPTFRRNMSLPSSG